MDNFNNLGNVITNPKTRTTIYATYTVLVVAYLIVDAFLNGAGIATPDWYGGISTALMAASIPVGTLAIANIPHTPADTPAHADASVVETARTQPAPPAAPYLLRVED